MEFTITKKENQDKDHCGFDTIYEVRFKFELQECIVDLSLDLNNPKRIHLYSKTDGYHWVEYFLCQEPNCDELKEHNYDQQRLIIRNLFLKHSMDFIPEGKDTCYVLFEENVTDENINTVALIIEERFANRERFFPN